MDASSTQSSPSHRVQLDGLRALAVLAVLLHHTMPGVRDLLNPGAAGVRLFFVLSGFLITGILLRARTEAERSEVSRGRVLMAFYLRRMLRIFPLYYVAILVGVALNLPEVRATVQWHLAYLSNHFVADRGTWPAAPLSHLWSLAVEEQFYLGWPLLLLFVPRQWLVPTVLTVIGIAPISRVGLAWADGNGLRAGVLTIACLDSLGVGALLALARDGRHLGLSRLPRIALWVGVPLFLAVAGSSLIGQGWLFRVFAKDLAYAMIAVWIVDRCDRGFEGWLGKALSWRPLVALGTISYGVYLLHDFIPPALRALGMSAYLPTEGGVTKLFVVFALTVPVAALSWLCFERPINDLKRWLPYVPISTRATVQRHPVPQLGPTLPSTA